MTAYSDANGQSFSTTYDKLSRPLVRTEPDLTTTWTWGNSASLYNIGKLQSVSAVSSAGTFTDASTYDSKTRLAIDTQTLPGDASYSYNWTYSSTSGLLSTLQYPISTSSYQLGLLYGYTSGLLSSITDTQTGTVYWTANTANPRGQVTKESLGNGVVTSRTFDAVTGWEGSIQSGVGSGAALQNNSFLYDDLGDVTQRQDSNQGLSESFFYDTDYRLDHSTLNSVANLQMTYDGGQPGPGNITARSDVASGSSWTYDSVKKHAVKLAGTGGYSYSYDGNGNAITRNGFNITWTSYNYASGVNSAGESATFQYGPDRQRWKTVYTGSVGTETTYHVGRLLEKVANAGVLDFRHYIFAGRELVGIYSRQSSGTNTMRYVLEDHQSSFANIVSSTGAPIVSESFTAYGNRRSGELWAGAPTTSDENTINAVSRQGYTGQTTLGVSMGLNHMNGRVQDAITGRFLSPDPHVPEPGNTQSFNRYTYVNNNPLSGTDPSGFFNLGSLLDPFSKSNPLNPFGSVGRKLALSGATSNYALFRFGQKQGDSVLRDERWLQPIVEIAACYYGGPYACAGASAYLTRLNGGSIEQALIAGALTYVSADVDIDTGSWAGDALARGALGGVDSSLTGGSFKQGFEFAAAGSLAQSSFESITDGWSADLGPGEVEPLDSQCGPGGSCYIETEVGRVPDSNVGTDLFGNNSYDPASPSCFDQSALCSRIANMLPSFNALSLVHDDIDGLIGHYLSLGWENALNVPTMIPAVALTEAAIAGEYAVPLLSTRSH